jgi:predicted N-acetyltransferase YhbS
MSMRLPFLPDDASDARQVLAAAANHRAWFAACARAENGGAQRYQGVTIVRSPGPTGEAVLAFPRLPAASASARIDDFVAACRADPPRQAACWSLLPTRPRDLGALLAARGFEWGWRPHWMALRLAALPDEISASPDGVTIAVDDDPTPWTVDDVPYYSSGDGARLAALARARPRRTWHVVARHDGRPVGHAVVFVTAGPLGVAGIYSVGVAPAYRQRGIGGAVTAAACRIGRAQGCHYALLNATGEAMYRRIGFVSRGFGQTWWLHAKTLAAPPPAPDEIAFAEAVARGDLAALTRLPLPVDLDAPLASGTAPIALAAQAGQAQIAWWLAERGALLDPVTAWELGWKERTARLIAEKPWLVTRRRGPLGATPLHDAAWNGDLELARLLLSARPDPSITDATYHGTPLGWARHANQAPLVALLETYEQERADDGP